MADFSGNYNRTCTMAKNSPQSRNAIFMPHLQNKLEMAKINSLKEKIEVRRSVPSNMRIPSLNNTINYDLPMRAVDKK